MNNHFESVKEFMNLMGQTVNTSCVIPTTKLANLRYALILEEVKELREAIDNDDIVEIADALADILYVAYGAYAAFGLNPGIIPNSVNRYNPERITVLPTVVQARTFLGMLEKGLYELDKGYSTGMFDVGVRYALDDINDSAYALADLCNIDLHSCFDEVHASNMSKACTTYEDAELSIAIRLADPETANKYEDVEIIQVGDRYVIARKDNGKVLKGKSYFEPNLAQYVLK